MDTMRVDATTIRSATAVADARGTTRAFLEALRQPAVASETADTAVLVVSELVTNALRHGGGTYTLRLATTRSAAWHQNPSRARCGVRCRKAMGHSPHRPCSLPPAMGEVGQGADQPVATADGLTGAALTLRQSATEGRDSQLRASSTCFAPSTLADDERPAIPDA